MSLKEDWLFNIKIHYIWTIFSSILFLWPIITLFYKLYWLDIQWIILLTAIFTVFSTVFEIPTSTLWDSIWRRIILRLSVISSMVPLLIYFFFPTIAMFYVAIIFSSLWSALWSGTGHAKLQEDLEASGKEKEFWKIIGRLIALSNIWKLCTPLIIYFILKYFNNEGYHILAGLDILFWSIAVFFVFQFREVQDINLVKWKTIKEFFRIQKTIFKKWFTFISSTKNLIYLLILMILWNDLGYLSKILLPSLVESWVEDFLTSYIVWLSILAWILWNLLPDKIANKIWWNKLFIIIIWCNAFLHFLAFYFIEYQIALVTTFIFICFIIWLYWPSWNHMLINFSNIKEKATVRSLFFIIIGSFEALFLYISSFFEIKEVLFILSIIIFSWYIIWLKLLFKNNEK